MKLDRCRITNITVFENQEIEFCGGVNVFMGVNGTGKSHLLKLLYTMIQSLRSRRLVKFVGDEAVASEMETIRFLGLLSGYFKPEDADITLLMRNRARKDVSDVEVSLGGVRHAIRIYADKKYQSYDPSIVAPPPNDRGIFIPPNDVLAIYPGFTASFELRELAFDQTYYDICKALSAAPLKTQPTIWSQIKNNLEAILQGSVLQKNDRFYVQSAKGELTLEAHLLAEGHRKIATLVHLINNGSINKRTFLFWDEPEANMNPRLIKYVASLLRDLAKQGVQIFIATHDYLLTGELSLAAEYKTTPKVPIRFFAMSRKGNGPVHMQSGDTLADLDDNAILDEFAAHYQREQDAVVEQLRRRGNE